jgi:hypothetical protein
MTMVRAVTVLGIGAILASCASTSESVDVASTGETVATSTADTSVESVNAQPCEGQDAEYGCYGIPQIVPPTGGLVMESSGPSAGRYPLGLKLDGIARITLKEGDVLSVLMQNGLREFKGPGTFRIGTRGSSRRSTYASLTRARSNSRVRTGAVRSAAPRRTLGPQMLVIRGDDIALGWYSEGRRLPVLARICLPDTAKYITFQRTDGGTITYGGGGCNKLADDPTTPEDESSGTGSGP